MSTASPIGLEITFRVMVRESVVAFERREPMEAHIGSTRHTTALALLLQLFPSLAVTLICSTPEKSVKGTYFTLARAQLT